MNIQKSLCLSLLATMLYSVPTLAIDVRYYDPDVKTFDTRPKNFPEELILLPKASEIRFSELGGTYQLSYKIMTDYPAKASVAAVSSELTQRGWRPLDDDYLNPGLKSSHVRGWSNFDAPHLKPPQTIHQWLADWENRNGDVLRYGFIYQYDTKGPKDLRNMTVIAIFTPAAIAKEMRREAIEMQKRLNGRQKK